MQQKVDNKIAQLSLSDLRQRWAETWGVQPHRYIRREMLEKSLEAKQRQARGEGLTPEQQKRLDNLIAQYKRNPEHFDQINMSAIKPGTRLVRVWQGKRYNVIIRTTGYEFDGKIFKSLSQIASDITGTRWNGWVFFGLKERKG